VFDFRGSSVFRIDCCLVLLIGLLFTKEQDIAGSVSLAFYRQRGGEAATGIGPIERAVLGDWPIVQTANITKEMSVI
jgi:hypothetical protein